jgi:hypothetical protein
MSGEQFSRYQPTPSALIATQSCVRGGSPAVHKEHAQFHCGHPPPAAVPSRITFTGA